MSIPLQIYEKIFENAKKTRKKLSFHKKSRWRLVLRDFMLCFLIIPRRTFAFVIS